MVDSIDFDLIICGSGLAGLRAAIAAAKKGPNLKIGIVSKLQVMRSHSVSAEGGTAAVLFEDEGDTMNLMYMIQSKEVIFLQIKMLLRDFVWKCQKKFTN